MKPKRTLAVIAFALCLGLAVTIAILLTPPPEWERIEPGMSQADVAKIVPVFDAPWGDIKADFKYEKRWIFTWQLAVMWNPAGVDSVERELRINWPDRRKIITLKNEK